MDEKKLLPVPANTKIDRLKEIAKAPAQKKKVESRSYSDKTLKSLYGASAGMCAYPACLKSCIKSGPSVQEVVLTGEIAHIKGVKPNAPRHDANMTKKERDSYPNLILLCNIHHPIIDQKNETGSPMYDVAVLEQWKRQLESFVIERMRKNMPAVSSAQLETVTQHLLDTPIAPNVDFTITDPARKMKLNELSSFSGEMLKIGLGKVTEVAKFVEHISSMSPNFAESLRAGFVKQYDVLWEESYRGDALFEALRLYASGYGEDPYKEAAGLAVLAYYFERCEVFKKA